MSKFDISCGVSPSNLTDEQMAVFKEGLFKSKGASNTRFGASLAIAGATADEIARLCANVTDRQFLDKSNPKHSPAFRAILQVVREIPDYWETVKGRELKKEKYEMLKKMGINPEAKLPVTKFDAKLSNVYLNRSFRASGSTYCMFQEQRDMRYDADIKNRLKLVEVFSPLIDVKFAREGAVKYLSEYSSKSGSIYLPDYEKNRKYEVDSLAHMDESITEKICPHQLMVDVLLDNFDGYFRSNPNASYSIQIMCLMEGFYEVCREMGIVGISDDAVAGRVWISQATSKGVMKSVIKMAGTYRRLVKNGFAESVARETVLAEINDNIMKRASQPQLRFYPRNDYKDTPEEEREQAKKASGAGTGTQRKSIMSIEDLAKSLGVGEA